MGVWSARQIGKPNYEGVKRGERTYCRGHDELAVESEEGMVVENLRTQLASAEGAGDESDDVGIY